MQGQVVRAQSKVGSLRTELLAVRRQAAAAENLKHEVLVLDKQLLREQSKTKALSEELETPLNVHRCIFEFKLRHILVRRQKLPAHSYLQAKPPTFDRGLSFHW